MKEYEFVVRERPQLRDPVLIEGLPGVGNVGKLAADHLIEELKAVKFADLHSRHFPPQVLVLPDGTLRLVNNEFYSWKNPHGGQDLVFLIGDYQGLTAEGQYVLADAILTFVKELGVKRMFTLGGYGTGQILEKPRVLGAATSEDIVADMKKHGVTFSKDEPGGGIVGASGLLLGLGKLRDMEGVCLMGETSGYLVDPKSARAVLEVISKSLGIQVDFAELENRAAQMDKLTQQLRDAERQAEAPGGDDLRYIG